MGGSQSKKQPTTATSPNNFEASKMTGVSKDVNVGTVLLERSILRDQQKGLRNKDAEIKGFVIDKTHEMTKNAAKTLDEYKQKAYSEFENKDRQIEALNEKLVEVNNEKISFMEQTSAEVAEFRAAYEAKIAALNTIIDERGEQIAQEYQSKFETSRQAYPVRSYTPQCADKITAVGACYKESRGKTLNCSQVVQELQSCVDEAKKDRL